MGVSFPRGEKEDGRTNAKQPPLLLTPSHLF